MTFLGALGLTQSDLSLGDAYRDLMQATRNPPAFRLAMVLDASGWLVIGALLLTFAAILRERAPIRAAFIAASAVGQLTGALGGFMRLWGIPGLSADYVAASGAAREAILASYRALGAVIESHFLAGDVLQGLGFLLVASAALSTAILPRWLGLWILVSPGLTSSLVATLQNRWRVVRISACHLAHRRDRGAQFRRRREVLAR